MLYVPDSRKSNRWARTTCPTYALFTLDLAFADERAKLLQYRPLSAQKFALRFA